MIRVTLLGTGAAGGTPLLGGEGGPDWGACDPAEPRNRRMRSAALVEVQGARILVDAGPDLRAQLLAVGDARLDAVVVTHGHADHIAGLDDLRQVNRITGRALPVFADRPTLDEVSLRFGYAFAPQPAAAGFFRPALVGHEVRLGETVEVAGVAVRTLRLDHRFMDVLGVRIGGFAYCTDAWRIPEESLEALVGVDTWVVGCFQAGPHPTHAHLGLVVEWAERIGARRTVLTHVSPAMDWAWLERALPPGLEAGWDGMVLEVAGSGA